MDFLKDIGLRLQMDEGGMVGDLDKDGKMSGYEKARQDANSANMREQKQDGGPMESEMDELMPTADADMVPDEKMEDNYINFIMQEALTEDEEDMLLEKLNEDKELMMLFDKVIDVAQEFAGSGPVEGPGSGVSDSIPARLSDGEFVFTAKAANEIGESELMRMMKDAEASADKRQELNVGGMPTEEEEVLVASKEILPQVQEPDMVDVEIRKRMMDPSSQDRYVRS